MLDGRVLGFTCLVVLLTGLIAGVFPALQASKIDINKTLKALSTSGSARSRRGGWLRALPALMIAEFALALVLLVGAGLMIKGFLRLMAVPKGFNPDGVLTLTLSPSFENYPLFHPGLRRSFYFQEALARVQACHTAIGGKPRNARNQIQRYVLSRCSVWPDDAVEKSRLYIRRHADIGAGDRREHCDLQRCECCIAAAASLPRP